MWLVQVGDVRGNSDHGRIKREALGPLVGKSGCGL